MPVWHRFCLSAPLTDKNEYATDLHDENRWQENMIDHDLPLDDYLDDMIDGIQLYNGRSF